MRRVGVGTPSAPPRVGPLWGDSITEGMVAEWSVEVGDTVAVDDIVVMIETDKVSVEVRAPVSGAVTELLAELDDVVEVVVALEELRVERRVDAGLAVPQ